MYQHNWMAVFYDFNVLFDGIYTTIHHLKCRNCGKIIICREDSIPETNGCPNEMPPKEKWKSPIREKDVDKRDYPKRKGK